MVTDNLLSFLLYGILIFRVVLLSVFHYFLCAFYGSQQRQIKYAQREEKEAFSVAEK